MIYAHLSHTKHFGGFLLRLCDKKLEACVRACVCKWKCVTDAPLDDQHRAASGPLM